MAFTVLLYSFSKKENSTARPTEAAREFACIIKTESGILAPQIELDLGRTQSPAAYNYAYIPAFNRFYYIEEWYFKDALWGAALRVDVLATYKLEIGAASLYILRAAAAWDGRIIDTLYPTKTESTFDSTTLATPWSNVADGVYILGVVNKQAVFGSVNYYSVPRAGLTELLTGLMDNTITEDNGFSLQDASMALQLSLVDPLQYIKSAIFLPVTDAGGAPMPAIPVFNWVIPFVDGARLIATPRIEYNYTLATKKHPQTASRGNYVNVAPYTKATLMFPPFGVIELDTTVICDVSNIQVKIGLDIPTGLGILEVFANGILLNKIESQIGVPIQLAQVTRNYMGAINSTLGAAGNIAGAIGSGMAGDIGGAISGAIGAVQGIGNAAASLIPRAQTMGSGGSYAQLFESARLDFQFFECVDDDINHNGRPLCEMRTPASLGGYMLVQDGDVPTDGTATENQRIRGYLESGFYYE